MLKKLLCLLLLCGMALPLFSCEKEKEKTPSDTPQSVSTVQFDLADCTVVYGDGANADVQKCASRVRNKLRTEFALDIPALAEGESTAEKEILIGATSRGESTAVMAKLPAETANAYRIELVGTKIVIVATNDVALETAVQYFFYGVLSGAENAVLELPSDYSYADSYGVDTLLLEDGVQIKKQLVSTVYGPNKADVDATLTYSRIIQLSHNGEYNGTLIATSESLDVEAYQIHRSTDYGKTWSKVGEVKSHLNGMVANWQPMLYELPCQVGDMPEGTILLAGCIRNPSTTRTMMCIYKSNDWGNTWSFVSTVAEADGFSTTGGLSKGLWEPFLLCDDSGKLYCYYSDETDAENHSQMIVCRSSTDGKTWSETQRIVAAGDKNLRPGMPTVTRLGDGRYFITYEIVGMTNNPIHYKITDDLSDWGDVTSIGTPVETKRGEGFGSAPYCCWIPAGGEQGMLIVTAMFDYGKTDDTAAHWLISLDYGKTWQRIKNPLYYEDLENPDHRYAYSPGLFAAADGKTLYYVNNIPSQKVKGKSDMVLAVLEISGFGAHQ